METSGEEPNRGLCGIGVEQREQERRWRELLRIILLQSNKINYLDCLSIWPKKAPASFFVEVNFKKQGKVLASSSEEVGTDLPFPFIPKPNDRRTLMSSAPFIQTNPNRWQGTVLYSEADIGLLVKGKRDANADHMGPILYHKAVAVNAVENKGRGAIWT